MALLRSFNNGKIVSIIIGRRIFFYNISSLSEDAHDDHGIQTRVVSRILLRVGELLVLSIHILEHIIY